MRTNRWRDAAAGLRWRAAASPAAWLVPVALACAWRLIAAARLDAFVDAAVGLAASLAANGVFAEAWLSAAKGFDGERAREVLRLFVLPFPAVGLLALAGQVFNPDVMMGDHHDQNMYAAWAVYRGFSVLGVAAALLSALSVHGRAQGSPLGALRRGARLLRANWAFALLVVAVAALSHGLLSGLWSLPTRHPTLAGFMADATRAAAVMFVAVAVPLQATEYGLLEPA